MRGPPHDVTAWEPAICMRSAQDIDGYFILKGSNSDIAFPSPLLTVCWFSFSNRILPLHPPHSGHAEIFLSYVPTVEKIIVMASDK